MPKRKIPAEPRKIPAEPDCLVPLPQIPVLPPVNHDATFWNNLRESAEESDRRKKRRLPSPPMYCTHCLEVKIGLPMSLDTLSHLATDPKHWELIRLYDEAKGTDYFMETLFHMNMILYHSSNRFSSDFSSR